MKYFAMIGGERVGPASIEELAKMGLRPDTYVWCKTMDDWKHADEVADICRYYRQYLSTPANAVEQTQDTDPEPAINKSSDKGLPLRFRRIIEESGTLAEAGQQPTPDLSKQPRSFLLEAIALTLLCCPLTGCIAIFFAIQTRKQWNAGKREDAYECARKTKMWLGITFFMGFLIYAFLGHKAGF